MTSTAIAQEACEVTTFAPDILAPLEQALASTPSNTIGCGQGVTVRLPGGVRVWRCAIDYAEGEVPQAGATTTGLLVQVGPQVVFQGTGAMTGASLADVRVVSVDLSGDQLEEWVVALRTSESQGMGVNRWELHAFTAAWAPVGMLPDVVDWGPRAFLKRGDGEGCAALITRYFETEGPGERSDTFLTGQLAVVTDQGGFELIGDGPVLERRLDAALQSERAAQIGDGTRIERDPLIWFRREGPTR